MSQITLVPCAIEGLLEIQPTVHTDARGYFIEVYNKRDMQEAGITAEFVQDNQSASVRGVLRGLHYQKQHPQAKLVRAISGEVFDVAVDLRADSPTYGQWHGVVLSAEKQNQFYVPEGFAHGYLVLSERAVFGYKVTDFYHPGDEGALAFNDPDIAVGWPGLLGSYPGSADPSGYRFGDGTPLIMSAKDAAAPCLGEAFRF